MHSQETISVFYGNGIRLKRRRTYEELLYTALDTQVLSESLKNRLSTQATASNGP